MKTELLQPALGRESLEEIAMVALEFGRLLMETGASARNVEEIAGQVAAGLGAERMDARNGLRVALHHNRDRTRLDHLHA